MSADREQGPGYHQLLCAGPETPAALQPGPGWPEFDTDDKNRGITPDSASWRISVTLLISAKPDGATGIPAASTLNPLQVPLCEGAARQRRLPSEGWRYQEDSWPASRRSCPGRSAQRQHLNLAGCRPSRRIYAFIAIVDNDAVTPTSYLSSGRNGRKRRCCSCWSPPLS